MRRLQIEDRASAMAFFENFISVIRQKWLDYVQANRPWLQIQMHQTSVRTPMGGGDPPPF
jgi:hypothetical protein